MARDVHGCEQDVAELCRDRGVRLGLGRRLARGSDRVFQFGELVVEVGERPGRVGVLEAHR